MPKPRGTTTRTRSRNAETNLAYRQRKLESDPTATPCDICGQLLRGGGQGTHRRQHILNGDIVVPLPHVCDECGEAYENKDSLRDHITRGHKSNPRATNRDPKRQARVAYVSSIARLPYREFIEELLK